MGELSSEVRNGGSAACSLDAGSTPAAPLNVSLKINVPMKCFDSEELKVWSNKSERTFTIKKYQSGKCYVTYRTIRQNKADFVYYENFASLNDWRQFLKTDEYYAVKGGSK